MPKLQCEKCDFEFEREQAPSRCPYCAAEGSIVNYKTAQDYLDD